MTQYEPDQLQELCNGLDDDCDGVVEESRDGEANDPEAGEPCQTGEAGECATGTTRCMLGRVTCQRNHEPSSEICDGLDNNCNGMADEGFNVGQMCTVGTGECIRLGLFVCSMDGTDTICEGNSGEPQAELCNRLDDDCDGRVDESRDGETNEPEAGQPCQTGQDGRMRPWHNPMRGRPCYLPTQSRTIVGNLQRSGRRLR